ncbi:MAG TPA: RDD family protein [Thermoanaerobaculia bacterium]|nr:RDD family protein [Thermoanaerobaculia bacterium]
MKITTPEHVEIQLEPAGAGSRFLAILIDSVVTMGIGGMLYRFTSALLPGGVAAALSVTTSFFLTIGWHIWFETHGGRTPGKRALALRVVDARGLPVSLHQALVRNIVRAIDFAPVFYGVGAIATMLDEQHRRLGDIVAGTLVIRDAKALAFRGEIGAERRYNALRTPRVQRLIRHRISLEEREFLLSLCIRSPKMTPVARYDLMEEVAMHYRKKLGVEEEQISGENFVRDLTAMLFAKTVGAR